MQWDFRHTTHPHHTILHYERDEGKGKGNADPTCPSPDAIKNTLLNNRVDKFSWLCCNNENCKVQAKYEMKS